MYSDTTIYIKSAKQFACDYRGNVMMWDEIDIQQMVLKLVSGGAGQDGGQHYGTESYSRSV